MISPDILRAIRNDLPMPYTVKQLGDEAPYSKLIEGYFRFSCPYCHEIRATVNPKNNLAHCFCCQENINNIDLLLSLGYDFKTTVRMLKSWLKVYQQNTRPNASKTADGVPPQSGNRQISQVFIDILRSVGKQ